MDRRHDPYAAPESASAHDLGAELHRYRRRPEAAILRQLGLSPLLLWTSPLAIAGLSFYLAWVPLEFLARQLGARVPVTSDPFWGPTLYAGFAACCCVLAFAVYVWPRFAYLAVYEKGFVCRVYRRRSVRFQDIADRTLTAQGGLILALHDSTKLWIRGVAITFPEEGIAELLKMIDGRASGRPVSLATVDTNLKAQYRRAALLFSAIIYAIMVFVPVSDAKCRAVCVKAFGKTVLGMPGTVFAPLLFAILASPFIYVGTQAMVLMMASTRMQTCAGLYDAKEIRRAKIAVIAGGIYFVALAGGWIAYASALGI